MSPGESSLDAGDQWFPDFISESILQLCPDFIIMEITGNMSLRQFEGPDSTLVEGLRETRIEQLEFSGISSP